MTITTAEEKICIEPQFLNQNYKEYVYKKICDQMLGKCNNEYGFVLSVNNDLVVIDNILSTTGPGVFLRVKFTIETLKPEIGKEFKGEICMIFQRGMFVQVQGKMNILIPTNKINGYIYNNANKTFEKNNSELSKGDTVSVIIDDIKYEHKNFSCVGHLA